MTRSAIVNPFYARRIGRRPRQSAAAVLPAPELPVEKVVIGNATLYRGDCFDVLPTLPHVGAVITDPPYGIGFRYRTCDDAPEDYDALMQRLVPELVRVTDNGPCFVWQSPMKADRWHAHFPKGWRIIAACKIYPSYRACTLSWDPVIFWSGRSLLRDELPRDWHVDDLRTWEGYRRDNPVPAPKPLSQMRNFCQSVREELILDPFLGSGTTGVAAVQAGKRFIGIERDPVYFEYACRRIAEAIARA